MRASNDDAIDEVIRAQQLCESLAVRYTADLAVFDGENGTSMAPQFHREVLEPVQREEYRSATVGLGKFTADFLNDDPLLRMDFTGLTSVLIPVLLVLDNAQQNGLDTSE